MPKGVKAGGFTLVELLVVIGLVAILASLGVVVWGQAVQTGRQAASAGNLRQLSLAAILFANENNGRLFPYRQRIVGGTAWWFGFETTGSSRKGEGERELDKTGSPLYPYLDQVGGVEICPGFLYDKSIWKPKYNGASFGYGYNVHLGGGWMGGGPVVALASQPEPSRVALFATCAQINTFQSPASPDNPLVEEFYGFDQREVTVHFRFGGQALVSFCDGHVRRMPMAPGTLDKRAPEAKVGRITPVGSFEYLR